MAGGRGGVTSRPRTADAGRARAEAWWDCTVPLGGAFPRPHRSYSRRAADPGPLPPAAPAATALGADLDGLPVVHFHHVKIKTVNPFPGRDKSAPLRVEVAADIH